MGNPKRTGKAPVAAALRNVGHRRIPFAMRSLLFISLFLFLRSALVATRALKTRSIDIWRPRNYTAVDNARTAQAIQEKCHDLQWDKLTVPAPDVTDQYTLAQLARMAANAYALPGAPNWWDLDQTWTSVSTIVFVNPLHCFDLIHRFTVVPNRMGEPNRWLPRPRFRGSGQHHRSALDQGYHAQRTHVQGR